MEFSDTFEIEGVTTEEVWLALSDPILIEECLPGCQFLVRIDDDAVEGENPDEVDFEALEEAAAGEEKPETLPEADPDDVAARAFEEDGRYATIVGIQVGSVNPSFETVVTITKREFPEMHAIAEGGSSNSSFELDSGMVLTEINDGVAVEWWAETDVFGKVARMGQRVMNPVANQVVNRFFSDVEDRISEVDEESSGFRDRVRNVVSRD